MRAIFFVACLCVSAAAAVAETVVVRGGAPTYSDATSTDTPIGATVRAARWSVVAREDNWVTVQRENDDFVERIVVAASSLGGDVTPDPAPRPIVSSLDDCRRRGLCHIALKAGHRFNAYMTDHSPITAKRRFAPSAPIAVCRLGELYRISLPSDGTWMTPATVTYTQLGDHLYEPADTIEVVEGVPPDCAPATADNPRKRIVGTDNPRPQMGIFVVDKAARDKVNTALHTSSRDAYELARKLAKRAWAGDRSFCEDAVDQAVGELRDDAPDRWKNPTLAAVKAATWTKILVRRAYMFDEAAPPACEHDLANYVSALQLADRNHLELMVFGY